jgi:hypothetical protein
LSVYDRDPLSNASCPPWHARVVLPFTLQYVAGHDNIETAMRCVHPSDDTF